jgi:hypothetical protein
MKLLIETIRRLILEGMHTPSLLPDDVVIVAEQEYSDSYWISYQIRDDVEPENIEEFGYRDRITDKNGNPLWGHVKIERIETGKYGNCDGAWKIGVAKAADGWGPLLYDCAIELATRLVGGLIPDRLSVSGEANAVWDYYMNNRTDVQKKQLDNLQDTFENGPADDCEQDVGDIFNDGVPWQESSLSKKYSKAPITIDSLKKINKWIEI